MSLIHYRPSSPDLIQEFFTNDFFAGNWFPALDVAEDAQAFTVKADLPGLKKEDIRLSFDNGILSVQGERQGEQVQQQKNYHRVERSYGKFVRSLNLGAEVNTEAIKADYKDGVLTVTVPKIEKAKPKAIDINVG